ncbi:hypothetical protein COY89_02615 [Candidatus Roizmanbacteria bacterium CG_4_10_14_0_8_um_filter_36_36]|uniref:Cytidylate kinase-like family protein n=1 Tax=Candidatus Roizmanbacteria bacterium CG10_big_fil_rev_8_21_14_0_10_36_26 TaxID=1974851 RepID=A0A2M8KL41_9BACT|nr:MAG: hypothetical protein COY89_02615 [Candidatus Roizmanbacteria bacterium CG_4_10_14_0_8_um_filter_36_36]PJE60639.1 MAG: hypothetical protein COU86_03320 [Candidatus Roizmanbacteria bacterium CG10_big_fil_rev_8_21_14_0_10_36_26]
MKKIFQLINKNLSTIGLFNFIKKEPTLKFLPIITISREKGSGGRIIAYRVAKKLGKKWRVYHKDIVDRIAEQTNLEKALINEIDENRISLVQELLGDFFGNRYPSLSRYYKNLVKVLTTIGQRGYAVIVGRGAEYLLIHALKVRIICEMQQRIKWEMEFENLSRTEAVRRIQASDENRLNFIQTLYKHDVTKAHHYDLVVRTGPDLSIEDAAELIVKAAKRRFSV